MTIKTEKDIGQKPLDIKRESPYNRAHINIPNVDDLRVEASSAPATEKLTVKQISKVLTRTYDDQEYTVVNLNNSRFVLATRNEADHMVRLSQKNNFVVEIDKLTPDRESWLKECLKELNNDAYHKKQVEQVRGYISNIK